MDSCKVVLTFEPVAKLPAFDQPTDSTFLVLSRRISRELGCLIPRCLSLDVNLRAKERGNLAVPRALSLVSRVPRSPLFTTKARKNEVPGEEAGDLICHKIFSEK